MIHPTNRITRARTGAITVALVASAIALSACADRLDPTEPVSLTARPHLGVGDVLTVTNASGGTEFGSLRWALSLGTGGEIIRFDPTIAGATIVLDTTAVVRNDITIEGPEDKGITLSGSGKVRVIHSYATRFVLRNLTIRDGLASADGYHDGGGVRGSAGEVVLQNVTLTNNRGERGSAVWAQKVTAVNSTVSGNTSTDGNGAIWSANDLTLVHTTVAFNVDSAARTPYYGAVLSPYGAIVLENSIIANNKDRGCWAGDSIVYKGTNIATDTTCGNIDEITIADPKLDSLRNNGGPSLTHALLPGSLALNAVQSCPIGIDQRYAPRGTQCDVGAFEFLDYTQVTLTIDGAATVSQTNGWAVVTGTIKCSRADQLGLAVRLEQQRAGREQTEISGTTTIPIACTTSSRPWSASVVPSTGMFQLGSGQAAAETVNAPAWVTGASAASPVRLYAARR
jgi:hypothetical protein